MTPNNTNTRRNIEHFGFRAAGNGARIRNQRAESSRNQVSLLNFVHKHAILRATPGGAPHHGGSTKVDPSPAKAQELYYRNSLDPRPFRGPREVRHRYKNKTQVGPNARRAEARRALEPPGAAFECMKHFPGHLEDPRKSDVKGNTAKQHRENCPWNPWAHHFCM
jgi:hypothetical protein